MKSEEFNSLFCVIGRRQCYNAIQFYMLLNASLFVLHSSLI